MTWTHVEEVDGVSHRAEPAVDSSETFEEFYAREFPAIVALACALSGSRTASEDPAQEALLAAHGDWDPRQGSSTDPCPGTRTSVAIAFAPSFKLRAGRTLAG